MAAMAGANAPSRIRVCRRVTRMADGVRRAAGETLVETKGDGHMARRLEQHVGERGPLVWRKQRFGKPEQFIAVQEHADLVAVTLPPRVILRRTPGAESNTTE